MYQGVVALFSVWTCLWSWNLKHPGTLTWQYSDPNPAQDASVPAQPVPSARGEGIESFCHGEEQGGLCRLLPGQWSRVRHLLVICLLFLCISAVLKGLNIS